MSNGDAPSPNQSGSYGSGDSIVDHGKAAWIEACTPEFMLANTDAPDFASFAKAGGFNISSQKAMDKILPSALDDYVRTHTRFDSWSEMKTRAFADWERRRDTSSKDTPDAGGDPSRVGNERV